jgi:hypothetical protein
VPGLSRRVGAATLTRAMGRPPLDPDARSTRLLLTLPQPERERLRRMVEATGAESLAALVRRYLAEGLARDTQQLEQLWSERPVVDLPLPEPTRRALLARKVMTAGDLLRVRDKDLHLSPAAIAAIRHWRSTLPL